MFPNNQVPVNPSSPHHHTSGSPATSLPRVRHHAHVQTYTHISPRTCDRIGPPHPALSRASKFVLHLTYPTRASTRSRNMGCSGSALRAQNALLQQQQLLSAERERSASERERSAALQHLMSQEKSAAAERERSAALQHLVALQQQAAAREHDMVGLLAGLGGKEALARNWQLGSSQPPLMLPPPPVPPPQLPPLQ